MNVIRAGSVVLEPQVVAHAREMFGVLSDPAIYEFENSAPESQTWLEHRFARLEARASPDGKEQWLNWVIRVATGELAGYVQATITRNRTAQVAYELSSKHWRQSIGATAVRAMLAELAVAYGVQTFCAVVKARNYRSIALLKILRFRPGPHADQRAIHHEQNEVVMYRGAGDFVASQLKSK